MSEPYLSVVIPAYNESRRIAQTLKSMVSFLDHKRLVYEIIVSDDGSDDGTDKIVTDLGLAHVRVIGSSVNRGKGFAVNQGVLHAKGQYILMCDADNATPFEQVEEMLVYMDQYDVVIGSRYLPESIIHLKQPLVRIIGSRILNLIVQGLLLPGFNDTQCGFKLFKQSAAQGIFAHQTIWDWGFDIEILVLAKRLGYKIKQAPVSWYDQKGSKINSVLVFFTTVLDIIKIKWLFATHHRRLLKSLH